MALGHHCIQKLVTATDAKTAVTLQHHYADYFSLKPLISD